MSKVTYSNRKWMDHFNCEYKKARFKAENTDGVDTPARLSNAETCFFGSNYVV